MKHLKEILDLPLNERIHLVETVWDSIAMETSQKDTLTPQQLRDLVERNEEAEKSPDKGLEWEEAKQLIRSGKWRKL